MRSAFFILLRKMPQKFHPKLFILTACIVLLQAVCAADSTTPKEEQEPKTLEDIGVRILNALIRFGKTELTKAQVQLLHKTNPEKSNTYEQLLNEEGNAPVSSQKTEPSKMLPVLNDRPQETLNNNWITVSNSTRFQEPVHVRTPSEVSKSPTEQMAKFVLDRVQKQIIPDIVKNFMNQRHMPTLGAQRELQPTMMSPEEQQRRRHMQQERLFQQLIDEQDHAKIVQPLRVDIKSQISPLPPDKRYKLEEEENQIRPSFKLEKDTVLVNGNSEGEEDLPNELENSDYSTDAEQITHLKRVIPRGNAIARRFLLMK